MPNTFSTTNYGRGNVFEIILDPKDTDINAVLTTLNNLTITFNTKDSNDKKNRTVYYLLTYNGQVHKHISILYRGILTTLFSRENSAIRGGEADSKGLEMKRDLACNIPDHVEKIFLLVTEIMKTAYDRDKEEKNKSKAISITTYSKPDSKVIKCFVDQYATVNVMNNGVLVDIENNKYPEKLTQMAIRGTSLINPLFILPPLNICLRFNNRMLAVFKLQNVLVKPGQINQNNYSSLENIVFSEEEKKQYNTSSIVETVHINKEEKNNTELIEEALNCM